MSAFAEPAGLYVHVPFCARACPYCDFDFIVGRAETLGDRIQAWLEQLERELARALGARWAPFDTFYVGGGTPSLLEPAQLRRLFELLEPARGQLREFSVELNPEHCDGPRLDCLVEGGVDRVSLGVQSLDPRGLEQLGRVHSREQGLAAIAGAQARGLRVSADLILGWPGQDAAGLERELEAFVGAGVGHLSVYALTIEDATPWPKLVRRGLRVLPSEDLQGELLERCAARLEAFGYAHYEVASYARPGQEAVHNGKYWRWIDVLGLGPSAASVRHLGSELEGSGLERRVNPRGLERWLADEAPSVERLERERAAGEGLWLGLRRLDGLEISSFLARFGVERGWLEAKIERQLQLGNLALDDAGARLAVAPGRWLWHDAIAIDLI